MWILGDETLHSYFTYVGTYKKQWITQVQKWYLRSSNKYVNKRWIVGQNGLTDLALDFNCRQTCEEPWLY